MKTINRFNIILLVCFLFMATFSQAQTILEGLILDEKNKRPLSYAAIIIGEGSLYATSNEDGRFRISFNKNIDSLEIRYLGYERKKISINYFLQNKNIYLKEVSINLSEVVVKSKNKPRFSNKNDFEKEKQVYNLLFALIKKYRNLKKTVKSKAYFTVNSKNILPSVSSVDTIPLEQIEGFYNSKQQPSKGILDLQLKTGRFGQNRLFPFYSLDYITILENFNLFKKEQQFLPLYPGNMSLSKIKRSYNLNLQKIKNYSGTIINFQKKKKKGDVFSGKIFFQEKDSIIEKIELFINDPRSFKLSPISTDDEVVLKNVKLNISFNPVDLYKIQYYDLNIDMIYSADTTKSNIKSKIVLYLYGYDTHFTKPYFTNKISFENDYDRLLIFPASNKIWEHNYPYPKSKKSVKTTNFFKRDNQFYSYYENEIPPKSLLNIKTSSIVWNYHKKLLSSNIKGGHGVNLNFSYALNSFKNENGNYNFIIKTMFDKKTSFFKLQRSFKELECINLAFDIYELKRHYLLSKIKESMTLEEVQILAQKVMLDARVMTVLMFEESRFGSESNRFNYWKNRIHTPLKKFSQF